MALLKKLAFGMPYDKRTWYDPLRGGWVGGSRSPDHSRQL